MCSWRFVTANESFLARQPMTKTEFSSKSLSYSFIVINKPCKAQFLLRVLACCNIRMCSLNTDCIFVFHLLPEHTALISLQACSTSDHRDVNRWDTGFESHVGREHMSAFFCVCLYCVGSGLTTGRSLTQGRPPDVYKQDSETRATGRRHRATLVCATVVVQTWYRRTGRQADGGVDRWLDGQVGVQI